MNIGQSLKVLARSLSLAGILCIIAACRGQVDAPQTAGPEVDVMTLQPQSIALITEVLGHTSAFLTAGRSRLGTSTGDSRRGGMKLRSRPIGFKLMREGTAGAMIHDLLWWTTILRVARATVTALSHGTLQLRKDPYHQFTHPLMTPVILGTSVPMKANLEGGYVEGHRQGA